MRVEMIMPQMGESIAEATILKWLKSVGEAVKKDETILEISTDKVDSEIPAPAAGVLVEILAEVGKTVPVKSVIAIIDTEGAASAPTPKAAEKPKAAEAPKEAAPKAAQPSAPVSAPAVQNVPVGAAPIGAKPKLKSPLSDDITESGVGVAELFSKVPAHIGERFYSPLVRNLAAQYGMTPNDLAAVVGSGTHGRVTKADVMNYIEHKGSGGGQAAAAPATKGRKEEAPAPRPEYGPDGLRVEPFDNMRRRIAEHMVRSKATSPHVYTVAEVDISAIARWRERNQAEFLKREGFKLSFTPFFLEATVKALLQYPTVNASVEGETLVLKKAVNLGCAVALGTTGLIVPVIKNADQLNLSGIARALNDMAQRARNKKLQPDEIQGGTFTVTNPGVFGSILGYPIINQPQLAILGVGAIKKRPVVVDDMIAIREIVYLTLSYDHRVIDGSMGGTFLNFIAKSLENFDPERTLA